MDIKIATRLRSNLSYSLYLRDNGIPLLIVTQIKNNDENYTSDIMDNFKVDRCMYVNKYKSNDIIEPTHIIDNQLIRLCDNDIILSDISLYRLDYTLINIDNLKNI